MNTVVHKKLPGYKPLLYWEGQLLLAAGFDLALADLELNQLTFLARLPASRLKRFFTRLRPVTRLLRLETGPAIDLGDGLNCLLCHQGSIYKINLQDGSFVKEFELPHGGRPLTLTKVDVPGFLPGIYLGEYFGNPEMGEARIFHRTEHGEWNTTYTFAPGEINHVHSIAQNPDRRCVYVLTGDFGKAACIWEAREQFTEMRRIGTPGQNSRACWLQVCSDRLVYATDTQLELNHLNCISLEQRGFGPVQTLQPIVGSAIYRAETSPDCLIFSTAVEPDRVRGNKYIELFSNRRGAGILSDSAHIYAGRIGGEMHSIYRVAKDFMPFRLFQFGSFQFPNGVCPRSDLIHAYGTALKGIDGCTVLLTRPPEAASQHEQS